MEIGSIFDINIEDLFKNGNNYFYLPFMKNKSYKNISFFNTGRSAIEYLLRQFSLEESKALLPSFTCASIVEAFKRAGVDYTFYSINETFDINVSSIKKKLDSKVKYIFFIQYFGGYQAKPVCEFLKELQSEGIIIIEDLTHSLYTQHPEYIGFGDYILGSIRKWLAIPDGAFICSNREIVDMPKASGCNDYTFYYFVAQVMKNAYLKNNNLDKQSYLTINDKAMVSLFSDYTIRNITDISMKYLLSYDMESVISARIKNYDYLLKGTENLKFIKPVLIRKEGQVPFGFTVLCDNRDVLLNYLISNDIYCNVHWKLPDECIIVDKVAYSLSKRILTIPCDHRYSEAQMSYIIEVLNGFKNY